MSDLPQRKKLRSKEYDYSSNGAYFITICVKNRQDLLGKIDVGSGILDAPTMVLSRCGKIIIETIDFLNEKNHLLSIDKYIIMPNHTHLIIIIDNLDNGASGMPRPTNARIPKLISSIKRYTNKHAGFDIWQTSYHDHIIRNEEDNQIHLKYIDENPAKWAEDEYYGGR